MQRERLDDDGVGVVSLTVKTGPGAGNVDLETTTVSWVGPTGSFYQLAESGADGNPDGWFSIETIQDEDNSSPVLNDQEDRLKIRLDLGSTDLDVDSNTFGNELGEGETATVRITTASGSQTTEEIVVPQTISGTSAVQL